MADDVVTGVGEASVQAPGAQDSHARDPGVEDRVLTIPNAISVVRLCCIPLFL